MAAAAYLDWRKFNLVRGQSASETYIVTGAANSEEAIAATGVAVNQFFKWDNLLKAQAYPSVSSPDGPATYNVTWQYSRPQGGGDHDDDKDKTRNPPKVKFIVGTEMIEVDTNIYGKPITNSAASPIRPKYRKAIKTFGFEVYKSLPAWDFGLTRQFMGKLNKSQFQLWGYGNVLPEECMCDFFGPTNPIQVGSPDPIDVVARFNVRNKSISGETTDYAWKYAVADMGRRAWFLDDTGSLIQAEISSVGTSEDPCAFVPVGDDVALNGQGVPKDTHLVVGQGQTINPYSIGGRGVEVKQGAGRNPATIIYDMYEAVEFQPLLNLLGG